MPGRKRGAVIVCCGPCGPEVESRRGETPEAEVLRQVRKFGGFSVFWITANRKRAAAGDSLRRTGAILPAESRSPFPWCSWRVA